MTEGPLDAALIPPDIAAGAVPRPTKRERFAHECRMAGKYTCVALLGFCTDAVLLKACLALGLSPAQARVISLFAAMNVTFVANGMFVFRRLHHPHRGVKRWLKYMLSNGIGNLNNYFVFLAFVSSRLPVISDHLFALACGGMVAWIINYFSTRWLVFSHATPGFVWPWTKARISARDEAPP